MFDRKNPKVVWVGTGESWTRNSVSIGDGVYKGTELGLWVSLDGGKQWAQYTGGDFPNVAVRDLAIHPRDKDLVIGTHGRGIWIIDDITPLRALTPEVLAREAVFIDARPTVQRMPAGGGWVNGDAAFVGDNPTDEAVITYYQQKRHIFGISRSRSWMQPARS